MAKPQKVKMVEQIKQKIEENPNFVITEYRGMSVDEISKMRILLREEGVFYKIYKNTLFKIALKDANIKGLDEYFLGPVGVAFSKEDIVAPCKVLDKVSKDTKKLKLKGGYASGNIIQEQDLEKYAKMPSKEELYSKLVGTLANPATKLVRVLGGPMQKLVIALKQIADKK